MTWFLTRHIGALDAARSILVFSAAEERHNIGRREALIGIRNQRPSEPGLAVRRTATVTPTIVPPGLGLALGAATRSGL